MHLENGGEYSFHADFKLIKILCCVNYNAENSSYYSNSTCCMLNNFQMNLNELMN